MLAWQVLLLEDCGHSLTRNGDNYRCIFVHCHLKMPVPWTQRIVTIPKKLREKKFPKSLSIVATSVHHCVRSSGVADVHLGIGLYLLHFRVRKISDLLFAFHSVVFCSCSGMQVNHELAARRAASRASRLRRSWCTCTDGGTDAVPTCLRRRRSRCRRGRSVCPTPSERSDASCVSPWRCDEMQCRTLACSIRWIYTRVRTVNYAQNRIDWLRPRHFPATAANGLL